MKIAPIYKVRGYLPKCLSHQGLLSERKEEYVGGNTHRPRSDIVHCSSCGKT